MSRNARGLVSAALIVLVAAVSIAVALLSTPMQQVTAAGQTVQVGVGAPSLSVSGPGELDLFGQTIPTTIHFLGPVRPRIRLTHITLSQQVVEFENSTTGPSASRSLQRALVRGFQHYFYWQVTVVAAMAVLLLGAISGWFRRDKRQTALFVVSGLVVTELLNLGAIMTTAYTAPAKLSKVQSLQQLVGGARVPTATTPGALPKAGSKVAVLGDSTAAGKGNALVASPTAADRVCNRSAESYAQVLAETNGWQVTNLACSGATIAAGLLGPQHAGALTVPPQLRSPAVADASTILLSIGANDVHWNNILLVCAVSVSCDNKVEQAYFQQQLDGFSRDYLQLISELQALPNRPQVLVNLYYAPLAAGDSCLDPLGINRAKRTSLLGDLDAMNAILAKGARAAAFTTVQPNFAGHGVCSNQPYVQGVHAIAPFHPTPAGELAIALADEHAMRSPATR